MITLRLIMACEVFLLADWLAGLHAFTGELARDVPCRLIRLTL